MRTVMINLMGKLLYKVIPDKWYVTKRVCDLIEKFCTDPILRSDVKVYMGIFAVMFITLVIGVCYVMTYKYKIKKLSSSQLKIKS
jgi:hypothetical protein